MIVWAGQRTGSSTLMWWLYDCDLRMKGIDKYDLKNGSDIPFPNLEIFNPNHGVYRNGGNLKEIFEQDFITKIHPEWCTDEFILDVIENSKNHQHVILYRESAYDRLLSDHYAQINSEYNNSEKGKATYRTDKVNVKKAIKSEIYLRKKYKFILDNISATCISYEQIYEENDLEILNKVFPGFNYPELFKRPRYPISKRYNEILGKEELEAACLELGSFNP